jgi:hypothetical protein
MLKPTILRLTVILISITTFLHAQEITRNADHRNPSIEKTRYIMLIDEAHQKQLPAAALSASNADSRQLAKIERIRTEWEKFFKAATNQHATIDASLTRGNRK